MSRTAKPFYPTEIVNSVLMEEKKRSPLSILERRPLMGALFGQRERGPIIGSLLRMRPEGRQAFVADIVAWAVGGIVMKVVGMNLEEFLNLAGKRGKG